MPNIRNQVWDYYLAMMLAGFTSGLVPLDLLQWTGLYRPVMVVGLKATVLQDGNLHCEETLYLYQQYCSHLHLNSFRY